MDRKNKVFPSAKDRLKALSLKSFSLPVGHYVQGEVELQEKQINSRLKSYSWTHRKRV